MAVSVSEGEGGYEGEGGERGEVSARMRGVYPYARVELGERLEAWGVAGYAAGELVRERGRRGGATTPRCAWGRWG